MRAALYLRVSTAEQQTANQRPAVEALAAARGWEVVEVIEEQASGSASARRPGFARLMDGARAGRYQAIGVWALDRFGRSFLGVIRDVLDLDRLGVHLASVREPWLDLDGPVRELLLAVFAWVAEQERRRLIERTREGLERARAAGVRLGRPQLSPLALRAAADSWEAGQPIEEAVKAGVYEDANGRRRHVSISALRRYLRARAREEVA